MRKISLTTEIDLQQIFFFLNNGKMRKISLTTEIDFAYGKLGSYLLIG